MSSTPLELLEAVARAQVILAAIIVIAGLILWESRLISFTAPLIGSLICLAYFVPLFIFRNYNFDHLVFGGLVADLFLVCILVGVTGGSEVSCYVPLYLMLPTFGLVVFHAPFLNALSYVLAVLMYIITFWAKDRAERVFDESGNKLAVALVTGACFWLTFYLDGKSRETLEGLQAELDSTRARYELTKSYNDIVSELASAGTYEKERAILQQCVGKFVSWKVRFGGWVTDKDSEQAKAPSLKFAIEPRTRSLYGVTIVDLRSVASYQPFIDKETELTVEGFLIRDGSNLSVLAIRYREER